MSTIILPDHNLIRHPTIIRRAAAPVLVNGGVVTDERNFKLLVFYREHPGSHPACEVLSVALTDEDFARTLIVASVDFLPALLHADRLMH